MLAVTVCALHGAAANRGRMASDSLIVYVYVRVLR